MRSIWWRLSSCILNLTMYLAVSWQAMRLLITSTEPFASLEHLDRDFWIWGILSDYFMLYISTLCQKAFSKFSWQGAHIGFCRTLLLLQSFDWHRAALQHLTTAHFLFVVGIISQTSWEVKTLQDRSFADVPPTWIIWTHFAAWIMCTHSHPERKETEGVDCLVIQLYRLPSCGFLLQPQVTAS